MRQVAPSPEIGPKPIKLEARVTDLVTLVQAVAAGDVPISVLTVNWGALDAIVEAQGAEFTMPGVILEQVAA